MVVDAMAERDRPLSDNFVHCGNQWYGINQTINGTKTYLISPVVPSKSTPAGNNSTTIATEAQVYLKQDKLTAGTNITIDPNTNTISANVQ